MRGVYGNARRDLATAPPATGVIVGASIGDGFWTEHPIEERESSRSPWNTAWAVAAAVSTAACVYHGYRRNDSVGWALGWGLFGGVAPVIAPALAVAQGFGKPKEY